MREKEKEERKQLANSSYIEKTPLFRKLEQMAKENELSELEKKKKVLEEI